MPPAIPPASNFSTSAKPDKKTLLQIVRIQRDFHVILIKAQRIRLSVLQQRSTNVVFRILKKTADAGKIKEWENPDIGDSGNNGIDTPGSGQPTTNPYLRILVSFVLQNNNRSFFCRIRQFQRSIPDIRSIKPNFRSGRNAIKRNIFALSVKKKRASGKRYDTKSENGKCEGFSKSRKKMSHAKEHPPPRLPCQGGLIKKKLCA